MSAPSFIWQAAYEVGDADIDAQHRHLFALGESLLQAHDKAGVTVAAMQLYRYVRVHFAHEEGLMRKLAFPGLRQHAAMHVELIGRLNALSLQIAADAWRAEDLAAFMQDWLLVHIAQEDARLAAFVREQPASSAADIAA